MQWVAAKLIFTMFGNSHKYVVVQIHVFLGLFLLFEICILVFVG